QRGILRESALDGFTRRQDERGVVHVRYGVTSYAVWSHAGTVYTVACDTPAGLDAIVTAYAQRGGSGEEGVGARIGRGLGRLFSWVNPLDAGSGR
ncbi:MAG TPA: transcriptional regulator, partial [Actinopolymorphaceae bacterium]